MDNFNVAMKELKAIYNLQRFQILTTKLNPNTTNWISDAYVYAWYEHMYPYLDYGNLHRDLIDCFQISKEKIDNVVNYADAEWLENRYYTFYEYENKFKKEGIDRHELIVIFRYFYLHDSFDKKFWNTLIKAQNYPTEAGKITSEFSVDSISFY